MFKLLKNTAPLFLTLFLFLFPPSLKALTHQKPMSEAEEKGLPLRHRSTKLSQVKSWQSLSRRYAIGLNNKKEVLAIYDLAAENRRSISYIKRTFLGSVGIGDFHLKGLLDFIKQTIQKEKELDADFLNPELPQELQKQWGVKNRDQVIKLLDKYKEKYGEADASMPAGWWKQVAWKNPTTALLDSAPPSFKLSDLDLEKLVKKKSIYTKILNRATDTWRRYHGMPTNVQIFDQFEYRMNTRGLYDLYYVKYPSAEDRSLPNNRYQPVLVVDIQYPNPGLLKPIGISLLKQLINTILQQIPSRIASTLIRYPINRWFRLYEQQLTAHRMAAFEGLNLAQLDHDPSPFSLLDEDDREDGALYILREEASIFGRILGRPKIKRWKSGLKNDLVKSANSTNWLKKHNYEIDSLNPWFVKTTRGQHQQIFALPNRYLFSKRPIVAIDYQNPDRERIRRNVVESMQFALLFLDLPIPYAVSTISQIFQYFVTSPIAVSKKWEARMAASMLHRQEVYGENWEPEIRHLYNLRLNPFELSRTEEEVMIQKRRELMKLPFLMAPDVSTDEVMNLY